MKVSEELLHQLSQLKEEDKSILSVYLDLTLGLNRVEDYINRRSNRVKKYLRGEEREQFTKSLFNLERFINEKNREGYNGPGLAFFADIGEDYKQGVELVIAPQPLFAVSDEALIFPLALELDEYERVGVIMVDSSEAKILLTAGRMSESVDSLKADIHHLSKVGGWSQMRYQRRRRREVKNFVKNIAVDAEKVFRETSVKRIILAGRERMMTALRDELSQQIEERIIGEVMWDLDECGDEFLKKIKPLVEQAEREQEERILGDFVGELKRGGLAVAGIEDTERALTYGAVDTLIIHRDLDEELAEKFTGMVESTDGHMEYIPGDNAILVENESVGALLRFDTGQA